MQYSAKLSLYDDFLFFYYDMEIRKMKYLPLQVMLKILDVLNVEINENVFKMAVFRCHRYNKSLVTYAYNIGVASHPSACEYILYAHNIAKCG